jgi:hypothetical protein
MTAFTITTLAHDEARSVYPLIREVVPGLELASWLRFARQLTQARRASVGGIVAARRTGRAFPCGLFCYRVDQDLERGRVLVAEHFVAVDLLDPPAVLAALVGELESLGRRFDCVAVRSVIHGADGAVAGGLSAAGHRPEGSLLFKSLVASAPAQPVRSRLPTPRKAEPETSAKCLPV